MIVRFPEVALRAWTEREPHHIVTYLTELAALFGAFYATEKIADADDTASPYRVAVVEAFATTMKNGLYLLGISIPSKM